ncbi:MFS transporter [Litchfieldia salsa]|uniref:Predicted arabinose efflux permease, MFS family n=1 Tax=Litchfieldia salsa TaxID=930152 RepID=A0A1H0UML3_9BACI|nr:MFS transporter [Litchfieldia salsa]SDP67572.1 Predicted arabinose efflux permease, MFS family [Litchfieldia salsa]
MKQLRYVGILLVITGIFVASNIYTLIPIYDQVAAGLHSSPKLIIWGSSIFSLCYAVGLLCFGPLSEIIGRKKVIVIGLLLSCITTAVVGWSFNHWSLILFRGIQGFALGSFAPVAFAYIFELYPEKKRTLLLALINSGFLMAGILGQLISSFLTLHYSWEVVFFSFACIYFSLFFLSYFLLPNTHQQTSSTSRRIWRDFFLLLKDKNLLSCYMITFTLLLSFVAFYDGLGRMLTTHYEIDSQSLMVIRAIGIIGTIFSIFTGRLINRYGLNRALVVGLTLGISSTFFMIVLNHQILAITILSILFVSSISMLIPIMITYIGKIGNHARGSALSLYSFVLLVGASVGPILASFMPFLSLLKVLLFLFFTNLIIARILQLRNEDNTSL